MSRIAWLGTCLVTLVLGGSGCSTYQPPDVTTHHDRVTGLRTDLLDDNLLDTGDQPRELVWLNASRIFRPQGNYEYYLEVTYMAREEVGLLVIEPGETLTIVAEQETIRLRGSGSVSETEEPENGVVKETALYKVSKLVMQKIAIARTVTVTLKGRNGLVERQFNPENFDKFRRFVTRYAL